MNERRQTAPSTGDMWITLRIYRIQEIGEDAEIWLALGDQVILTCQEVLNGGDQGLTVSRSHKISFGLFNTDREVFIETCSEVTWHTSQWSISLSHPHEDERLGFSLLRLRQMKIHLVSIKVSVVRRTHTLIEAKRPMRFHTRLEQTHTQVWCKRVMTSTQEGLVL